MWNYAELSQMAKALGGPEKLVETLTKKGVELGAKQAKTKYGQFIALALSAGVGLGCLITIGVGKLKARTKSITENELKTAEAELIAGIKAYDDGRESSIDAEPLPDITREEAEAKIDKYVKEIADEVNDKEDN